jgi:multidrug transporter EmrE-like cation transporter
VNPVTAALLVASILLSAGAQIALKVGMRAVAAHPAAGPMKMLLAAAFSPWVIVGLSAYVASAVVWLLVLSKLDVSRAYPCVAAGFVLTLLAGHFLLGETVGAVRLAGIGVVLAGVTIVALN